MAAKANVESRLLKSNSSNPGRAKTLRGTFKDYTDLKIPSKDPWVPDSVFCLKKYYLNASRGPWLPMSKLSGSTMLLVYGFQFQFELFFFDRAAADSVSIQGHSEECLNLIFSYVLIL